MKTKRHERGQVLIETVLLIVVFIAAAMYLAQLFRDKAVIRSMVQGPWAYVQGMVEAGVWGPAQQARMMHPNLRRRHETVEGEGQ